MLAALLAAACGPPAVRPTAVLDPTVACPGGWTSWSLEVLDQRANREGSERLVATVRDAITKSFPGCSWSGPAEARPTVTIEVHRFAAPFEEGMWMGAAEWSVWVRDPDGRTLKEFEARASVDRPNWQGSNNEKEALQEVFRQALEQTAAVLRSVSGGAPTSSSGDTPARSAPSKSLKAKGLS